MFHEKHLNPFRLLKPKKVAPDFTLLNRVKVNPSSLGCRTSSSRFSSLDIHASAGGPNCSWGPNCHPSPPALSHTPSCWERPISRAVRGRNMSSSRRTATGGSRACDRRQTEAAGNLRSFSSNGWINWSWGSREGIKTPEPKIQWLKNAINFIKRGLFFLIATNEKHSLVCVVSLPTQAEVLFFTFVYFWSNICWNYWHMFIEF